jgi:hypothetical protein
MKKIILSLFLFGIGVIFFNSCEKDKEVAPQLPPYESMAIDFTKFTTEAKSASDLVTDTTKWNLFAAGVTVFAWNAVLTGTLIVPVATFYQAINQTPTYLGNKTWQWEFDGTGFASNYHARLTGTIRETDVKWEMYISNTGIIPHDEFIWFEGTSNLDGNIGQWILYHSYLVQEAVLQIDWSKTGDQVGSVKYTYVRESSNLDPNQLTDGSYLQYGLADNVLDAFYTIDYNTRNRADSANLQVNIEWSTTEYNGRIKAAHYFINNDPTGWHCWDSQGFDVSCE